MNLPRKRTIAARTAAHPTQSGNHHIGDATPPSRSFDGRRRERRRSGKDPDSPVHGGRATLYSFTFVEVLIVVALMAVLAVTIGIVLNRPGEGVALQAGQATLATLCTAARGRAVVAGAEARMVVAADPGDLAGGLRYLQIVRADPAGADRWLAEGSGFVLPPGVYVVPPNAAAVPGDPGWPESRCSTALSPTADALTINGVAAGSFYSVSFTSRGTTRGGSLVLASGRVAEGAGGPRLAFCDPDRVRGLRLRTSGTVTLLDEAGALEP